MNSESHFPRDREREFLVLFRVRSDIGRVLATVTECGGVLGTFTGLQRISITGNNYRYMFLGANVTGDLE